MSDLNWDAELAELRELVYAAADDPDLWATIAERWYDQHLDETPVGQYLRAHVPREVWQRQSHYQHVGAMELFRSRPTEFIEIDAQGYVLGLPAGLAVAVQLGFNRRDGESTHDGTYDLTLGVLSSEAFRLEVASRFGVMRGGRRVFELGPWVSSPAEPYVVTLRFEDAPMLRLRRERGHEVVWERRGEVVETRPGQLLPEPGTVRTFGPDAHVPYLLEFRTPREPTSEQWDRVRRATRQDFTQQITQQIAAEAARRGTGIYLDGLPPEHGLLTTERVRRLAEERLPDGCRDHFGGHGEWWYVDGWRETLNSREIVTAVLRVRGGAQHRYVLELGNSSDDLNGPESWTAGPWTRAGEMTQVTQRPPCTFWRVRRDDDHVEDVGSA